MTNDPVPGAPRDEPKPDNLSAILGREVMEGEPLSHEEMTKVGRHVMERNRSALAALAKS